MYSSYFAVDAGEWDVQKMTLLPEMTTNNTVNSTWGAVIGSISEESKIVIYLNLQQLPEN